MSVGKYSPNLIHLHEGYGFFDRNCYGEPVKDGEYTNYDPEGFDWYGYSAFDLQGNFVGSGNGIDRSGNTEMDYLTDRTGLYDDPGHTLKEFIRKKGNENETI